MNFDALKKAALQTEANRKKHLWPALSKLKVSARAANRGVDDDKDLLKQEQEIRDLRRQLQTQKEAYQTAISEIELQEKILENTQFLVNDRKAAKKRRRKRTKETHKGRGKGGDGSDWEIYDVCRSMDEQIKKAKKQGRRLTQAQAAARVIKNYNAEIVRIQVDEETLCRYYRNWKNLKRKRKTD